MGLNLRRQRTCQTANKDVLQVENVHVLSRDAQSTFFTSNTAVDIIGFASADLGKQH